MAFQEQNKTQHRGLCLVFHNRPLVTLEVRESDGCRGRKRVRLWEWIRPRTKCWQVLKAITFLGLKCFYLSSSKSEEKATLGLVWVYLISDVMKMLACVCNGIQWSLTADLDTHLTSVFNSRSLYWFCRSFEQTESWKELRYILVEPLTEFHS